MVTMSNFLWKYRKTATVTGKQSAVDYT